MTQLQAKPKADPTATTNKRRAAFAWHAPGGACAAVALSASAAATAAGVGDGVAAIVSVQ